MGKRWGCYYYFDYCLLLVIKKFGCYVIDFDFLWGT